MKLTPQQFDVIMARQAWPHCQDVIDLLGHIAALDAEIARLREAFSKVRDIYIPGAQTVGGSGRWATYWHCSWCYCSWPDGEPERHWGDCPFKVLEEGK